MVTILHTEASGGLGGQELRTLREAEGMRKLGHEVIFAVKARGGLAEEASKAGFVVYELSWQQKYALGDLWQLLKILRKHQVQIVNTHSSWDAWLGGIAARMARRHILRTRHLSTPIRPGWNSRILYGKLADIVVTTCKATAEVICDQANLPPSRCFSVPTGVDPTKVIATVDETEAFKETHGLRADHFVVGTACVLRSWKGVVHLLEAAALLKKYTQLRILIVGNGPAWEWLHRRVEELDIKDRVIFTGHLANPYPAMAAMDVFALLSLAHEGVSQAVLQAAYLGKPLITTRTGGLPEVCIDGKTGFTCDVSNPLSVAEAMERFIKDPSLGKSMGSEAAEWVANAFTMEGTLNHMADIYRDFM